MLIFKRDEFKAGTMIIDDREENKAGEFVVVKVALKASDKNKQIKFNDEDFVLEKYGQFFKKV